MKQRSIPAALLLLKQIATLNRQGILHSEIGQVFPLHEIQAAAREAATIGRQGKTLVRLT